METINIAILGCGTVGGGVAQIISELENELGIRANKKLVLKKIVELDPQKASERFSIRMNLFCGGGKELTLAEAGQYIDEIITSDDIDLVVETIGGKSDFVHDLCIRILNSGKHLVTANKSLLAERGRDIFETAEKRNVKIGFEAAVCGSIPIIKAIKEGFTGDKVQSISGIMNGTSNYILTLMQSEKLEFAKALQLVENSAQWTEFFDLAAAAKGEFPADLRDEELLVQLPALFRTMRGEPPSEEQIEHVVQLLRKR